MTSFSDFKILGRIGEGQFGVVDAVSSLKNGQVFAMKSITKPAVTRHQIDLYSERDILIRAGRHAPFLYACFRTATAFHLVMEYAACGSLWDHITVAGSSSTRSLSEAEIGWWGNQMIESIDWIHDQGYAHRDIKPQNFLLFPDKTLKLTDFGSVARLVDGIVDPVRCATPVGTPDYIAPEILELSEALLSGAIPIPYTKAVDWWSLGATLFELLIGRPPFYADSINATYDKIKSLTFTSPSKLQPVFAVTLCRSGQRRRPDLLHAQSPSTPKLVRPINYDTSASTSEVGHLFDLSDVTREYPSAPEDDRWLGWAYNLPSNKHVQPITPPPLARAAIPHSTLKHRSMSDHRAYKDLLQCIRLNARPVSSIDHLEKWLASDKKRLQSIRQRLDQLASDFDGAVPLNQT